jgi:hypothetical protein
MQATNWPSETSFSGAWSPSGALEAVVEDDDSLADEVDDGLESDSPDPQADSAARARRPSTMNPIRGRATLTVKSPL